MSSRPSVQEFDPELPWMMWPLKNNPMDFGLNRLD